MGVSASDAGTQPPDGPPIVVLVTDGEPNGCASNPRAAVVNEVRRAFTAGIRTFVISVGTGVAASHLQDIANAGVGRAAGAPYWVATDPSGLVTAVNTIVVGARSCEMDVTGEIDPAMPRPLARTSGVWPRNMPMATAAPKMHSE